MIKKYIAPSLICADLLKLSDEVASFEQIGCEMLHIDIIDGIFSSDMPLGIDIVKRLRDRSKLIFDAHLMAVNNTPYVEMLAECPVDRLCFHVEFEPRPAVLLRKIKAAGIKAGIALSPEIPVSAVVHLLSLCDFVLVMRIDAGCAHLAGHGVYPFVDDKIRGLKRCIDENKLHTEIEVDGRVGFDDVKPLSEIGADVFVSGSKGLFYSGDSRENNMKHLREILRGCENTEL